MVSVDKFSYSRKQTKGSEFIPCSNDVYPKHKSLKAVFKAQVSHKFDLNHCTMRRRIAAPQEVANGRNRHCDVVSDVPLCLYLTLMASNGRYMSIFYVC